MKAFGCWKTKASHRTSENMEEHKQT